MDARPEAVLFDLDNTLIPFMEPLCAWASAWAKTAAEPKHHAKVTRELVEATLDGREDPQRGVDRVVERWDLAHQRDAAEDRAQRAYQQALSPYPGVCGLLGELDQRGTTLGVVTDAPRERAMHRLTQTQLAGVFDVIVTRDETPDGKRGPEPFHLALSVLDHNPRQAAMIGDWPAYDVEWPQRLGMRAVLAGWGQDPEDPRASFEDPPCPVAGSPSEVTTMLFEPRPRGHAHPRSTPNQAQITAY